MAAEPPLEEVLLPCFDVSDTVACLVAADAGAAWSALLDTDLIELGRRRPMVGVLGGARAVPELVLRLLRGEGMPPRPASVSLRGMAAADGGADGEWTLLGEEDHAIALGLVGRFWRPVIEYRQVDRDGFPGFAEPGWAKTVYCLAAVPAGESGSQLRATMRTATTDPVARRRFRRYWTLGVGSGARLLATALLESARDSAEASR